MSAQYSYIVSTGVITIDTADLLADVQSEWIESLGVGLDVDASTPQGTLIATETLARTSVMKNNAELGSLINPNYSYGVYLDAIAALLGIERTKNVSTMLKGVTAEGTPLLEIPAGSLLTDSNGTYWYVLEDVQITSTGKTNNMTLASKEYGSFTVAPDEEFTVVQGYDVIGWSRTYSTSSTTTVPGTQYMGDGALKAARVKRLYQQGIASLGAIRARAMSVDGVESVMVVENDTGVPGTVRGITFSTPNGVWVCASGTFDKQVFAETIFKAKMGGQPWDFGATNQGNPVNSPDGIEVVDSESQLSYFVKFNTAVIYDLYVDITVSRGTATADAESIIAAVLNYGNGNFNGEQGYTVGQSQSSFEIASAVSCEYPGLYIKDCKIAAVKSGQAAPTYPSDYGSEWIANPWDKANTMRGFINVKFV